MYEDEDKLALLEQYSLTWQKDSGMPFNEPDALLRKFILGESSLSDHLSERSGSTGGNSSGKDDSVPWFIFGFLVLLMGFIIILVKILPPEAYHTKCK